MRVNVPRHINANPSFGSINARSTVVLTGTDIGASATNALLYEHLGTRGVRCYFGDAEVVATIISRDVVACLAPLNIPPVHSSIMTGSDPMAKVSVLLRLSIDGGSSKFAVAQKYFTYTPRFFISSVSPDVAVAHQELPLVFHGSGLQCDDYRRGWERIARRDAT